MKRQSKVCVGVVLALVFSFVASVFAGEAFAVDHLRCEYLDNPQGIDVPKPRLSWIIQSGRQGEVQTAYRIIVASSQDCSPGIRVTFGTAAKFQRTRARWWNMPAKLSHPECSVIGR